jgi:hypothetical protein
MYPGVDGMILKYFLQEIRHKMLHLLKRLLFYARKLTITLVFKKNSDFCAENWQQSSETLVTTLTTGYDIIHPCISISAENIFRII